MEEPHAVKMMSDNDSLCARLTNPLVCITMIVPSLTSR
jgi:hypothetical protein